MKISLNWLKQYVSCKTDPAELANILTLLGLEVEEVEQLLDNGFSGVIVSRVLEVEKHPNADKLSVCRIDTGKETVQVVCGAPNVAPGQLAPFAPVGAKLESGVTIGAVNLRGVDSQGMICSERELGLSDSHEGIMVLSGDSYQVGEMFGSNKNQADTIYHIDVTPNRPDCLSHIGIAREVAAACGSDLVIPESLVKESSESIEKFITIAIEDTSACPRYSARYIEGVTIAESPQWLKERISAVGIRPINNVVDITNFVLMETGHPLHAFDYRFIKGKKIEVRKAQNKETFTTLDGVTRVLTKEDLLICDGENPIALAGIMGGENSEVSDNTTSILLESAYFDPMTIRKSAKRLGLATEASHRFERGADPNNTIFAVNRAARLIAEICGGKVAAGIADAYPEKIDPVTVDLRPERINLVCGENIPVTEAKEILQRLQFTLSDTDPITVSVPTFRPDVTREIDLIEEVLRHYGYDKITPAHTQTVPLSDTRNHRDEFKEQLRDLFAGFGLCEVLNNSMVPEEFARMGFPHTEPFTVSNPLNPETAFLRTSLIPGILLSVEWNRNRSTDSCRFYEIGKVFAKAGKNKLPHERDMVSFLLTGKEKNDPLWLHEDSVYGYFHLKGLLEKVFVRFHLGKPDILLEKNPFFIDETSCRIYHDGSPIGWMGEIAPDIREKFDIEDPSFAAELDIDVLEKESRDVLYKPIPKFPAVKRDVAFLIKEEITVSAITKCMQKAGGEFIHRIELFDIYKGKQIPAGMKSVAFSLSFLSRDKTLTENEIENDFNRIIKAVEKDFDASLRS